MARVPWLLEAGHSLLAFKPSSAFPPGAQGERPQSQGVGQQEGGGHERAAWGGVRAKGRWPEMKSGKAGEVSRTRH